MNIIKVQLSELRSADKNTRIHNRKQIEELVRSLRMFGQIRPAVIDENNTVWCGNGMVEAAREAGWTEIDAYRIVGLTETQKKKLMLADNQTFLLGATNTTVMDEILTEIQDFDVPGFDADTLEQLYGTIEKATEEISTYGVLNEKDIAGIERAGELREAEKHVEYVRENTQNPQMNHPEIQLPSDMQSTNGMVNIPKDKETRPYIICPRCGEKIYI